MRVALKPAAKHAASKRAAEEPAEPEAKKVSEPAAVPMPLVPDAVTMQDLLERRIRDMEANDKAKAIAFVDEHLPSIAACVANPDNWNVSHRSVQSARVVLRLCPSELACDVADELSRRLVGYKFSCLPLSMAGQTMLSAELRSIVPPAAAPAVHQVPSVSHVRPSERPGVTFDELFSALREPNSRK